MAASYPVTQLNPGGESFISFWALKLLLRNYDGILFNAHAVLSESMATAACVFILINRILL